MTFGANNTGSFGSSGLTDPWSHAFDNLYQANLVNWTTVRTTDLRPGPLRQACGEEMMVITSSALQPAAETFASDRTAHGVLTSVFVTDGNDGIGVTPRDIWTAIDNEYSSATCVRPEYVTLFGDTSQVPTFAFLGDTPGTTNPRFYEDPVATDMPYGFLHQGFAASLADITDFHQDVLVGRIPAPDLATATSEVAAITRYDDTPPTAPAFSTPT